VDIRGGSLERGVNGRIVENVNFRVFGRYVFDTLGNETNIISGVARGDTGACPPIVAGN